MLTTRLRCVGRQAAQGLAHAALSRRGFFAGDAAKYAGKDANGTMHFPGITPDLAEWLLNERSVLGLAVDTLSLDNGPSKDFKTHHIWLLRGDGGLENVANLEKLSPAGALPIVGLPKVKAPPVARSG
jgi:kynurenine formamidase